MFQVSSRRQSLTFGIISCRHHPTVEHFHDAFDGAALKPSIASGVLVCNHLANALKQHDFPARSRAVALRPARRHWLVEDSAVGRAGKHRADNGIGRLDTVDRCSAYRLRRFAISVAVDITGGDIKLPERDGSITAVIVHSLLFKAVAL